MKTVKREPEDGHPEQKTGEIFLGNMNFRQFGELPHKTKRAGNIPMQNGNLVENPNLFPVFAQAEEVKQLKNS